MTPLLLLTIGRSGSTMMMRILASHPQIVADERYPLEQHLLQSALFPGESEAEPSSEISVESAAEHYAKLAELQGKTAAYFAEKLPAWADTTTIRARKPDARFLCIIRDPRDVLLSARSFDKKRGYRGFQEQDGDTDGVLVDKYLSLYGKLIERIDRTNAFVVRYESLIDDATPHLVDLWRTLGLTASEDLARNCIGRAHRMESGLHKTSTSTSVQRWRTEMDDPLRQMYSDKFRHVFARLGYPLS